MLDTDNYNTIDISQSRSGVVTLALDRPEVMNATNAEMESELCRAFTEISHDVDTRVVVLTGKGAVFCGGGDFNYIREGLESPEVFSDGITYAKRLIFCILDCSKPVVGRINGHAMGLGATLALFCDVTFVAEGAKIADPHVAIGLVAGDGGAVIWPQLIGYNRAKEFLFTGEHLTAKDAAAIGLVNHAVPLDELDTRVDTYVEKLLTMPPRALQWTKASINIGLKQLAHSIMDASMAYEALSNTTEEHRHAFAAMEARMKARNGE